MKTIQRPTVGDTFFEWTAEDVRGFVTHGPFPTIEEAIDDYEHSKAARVYHTFPTFSREVVDDVDNDGSIIGHTGELNYRQQALLMAYGDELLRMFSVLQELSERNTYAEYRDAVNDIAEYALSLFKAKG